MILRKVIDSQYKLGQVAIEEIEFDPSDRDDIGVILRSLCHLWKSEKHWKEAKEIMEGYLPAGVNPSRGRPGMDWWRVTVLANLKQGLDCDFDRLQSLANNHKEIRQVLGHSDLVDDRRYKQQTLVDNVNLLPKEALDRLGRVVVSCGHELLGHPEEAPLHSRMDSSVTKTNIAYPTDVRLLWDSTRCMLKEMAFPGATYGVGNWRKHQYWAREAKTLFNRIRDGRKKKRGFIRNLPQKYYHSTISCKLVVYGLLSSLTLFGGDSLRPQTFLLFKDPLKKKRK